MIDRQTDKWSERDSVREIEWEKYWEGDWLEQTENMGKRKWGIETKRDRASAKDGTEQS